jgi:hypothetical protein
MLTSELGELHNDAPPAEFAHRSTSDKKLGRGESQANPETSNANQD